MYLKTWKEFETASYNLLLRDPTKVINILFYFEFKLSMYYLDNVLSDIIHQ